MNDMTHTASGDNGLKKPSARYAGRLRRNRLGLSLSMFAMAVGLAALFWILGVLLYKGLDAISWSMFVESTPAPGSAGGLANAMWGSLLLVGVSALVSTPVGILAGIYLSEYGASSRFGSVTRFVTDIMLSAPSIVIGLFVYALVVAPMGYFSGWAGSIALALIALACRRADHREHVASGARTAERGCNRVGCSQVACVGVRGVACFQQRRRDGYFASDCPRERGDSTFAVHRVE